MRIMKRFVVAGFACASIVCAMVAFAQDDLDNLLNDLESDGKKSASASAETKPAVEEKKAEEAPAPEAEAAPAAAPAPAVEEKKEEVAPAPKAEAVPAAAPAPAAEEKKEEVAVAAPAEADAAPKQTGLLDNLASVPGEKKGAEAPASAPAVASAAPSAAELVAAAADPADPNAALVSDLMAAEALRREAMDKQAFRELTDARAAMSKRDWDTSYKKYGLALKNLNDRADSVALRKEC